MALVATYNVNNQKEKRKKKYFIRSMFPDIRQEVYISMYLTYIVQLERTRWAGNFFVSVLLSLNSG